MDKKKVLIALIIAGLFLSSFILIANASPNFVGSKKSDVYHYPWCHYVDRINPENLIYFDTPEDAIAAGYRPCKVCKPPTSSVSEPTPTPTPTPSPTPTPTPTPSPTLTPTPSPSPTPSPTPSQIPSPTSSPTPSPTPSPIRTPTVSTYIWKLPLDTSKFGESGITIRVIDGDTIEVEDVGRIRLADVNTPEMDSKEGREAKEYVKGLCYQKKVYLDIDDLYITGKYGRIIAVVYVPYNETHYVNLNQLLLKEGYAEAKDYPNEFNPDVWQRSPLEYTALAPSPAPFYTPSPLTPTPAPTPTPIPGFEFLFAIIGVLAAIYLIRRRRYG